MTFAIKRISWLAMAFPLFLSADTTATCIIHNLDRKVVENKLVQTSSGPWKLKYINLPDGFNDNSNVEFLLEKLTIDTSHTHAPPKWVKQTPFSRKPVPTLGYYMIETGDTYRLTVTFKTDAPAYIAFGSSPETSTKVYNVLKLSCLKISSIENSIKAENVKYQNYNSNDSAEIAMGSDGKDDVITIKLSNGGIPTQIAIEKPDYAMKSKSEQKSQ